MKWIKYELVKEVNIGTEEVPNIITTSLTKRTHYNAKTEETAKKEAYNGEYEIYDDGKPEPDTTTTDDVLNAMLGVM